MKKYDKNLIFVDYSFKAFLYEVHYIIFIDFSSFPERFCK